MPKKNGLKSYHERRDFTKTPEPQGRYKKTYVKNPLFVIQKHDATSLHYDFRIEINGTLKSWAVPKGPSLDPREKRLAILTEDHPITYAQFEGIIPEGQYGAGPVLVWDIGHYQNIKRHNSKAMPMEECFDKGIIEIFLHGKKLEGGFALIRTEQNNGKNWLLIKMKDDFADARRKPVSSQPESVLSGKTIEKVEK